MTDKIEERPDRDEQIMNDYLMEFIKRYEPKDDEHERIWFHTHLHSLVRQAYGLAAKPYERTMQSMLKSLPIVNFIPTEKKS